MIGRSLAVLAAVALVAAAWAVVPAPPAGWFEAPASRRVLDRDGGLLLEVAAPQRGRERWVELDAVSPLFVEALLASEDHRFRWHLGLDPQAVLRAAWADLRAGALVQGGSTISQQCARLLAGRRPGLRGKLGEAWAALRLERHLSKDAILTWYLNRVYFGHRAWGIEAAARIYFDESAASLSLSEAATLVALLPAPAHRDLWTDLRRGRAGRDQVLRAMAAQGSVSPDELERALAEPLQLRRPPAEESAQHLARELLAEHPQATELRSTIDPGLQREAQRLLADHLERLDGAADQGAIVVLDATTGQRLVHVGSVDWAGPAGQVDGARAPRSPGSALKPFVYALAFERGLRPAEVLVDLPRRYATSHGVWSPSDYHADRFEGPVSARVALASSLNLPAVEVLERIGVATLRDWLVRLGVRTLPHRAQHYGLGLALGGGEVTLVDLAGAYGALASGGLWRPPTALLGEVGEPRRVLDERAAWLVGDVLSDPVARVPGFGRFGPLEREPAVAVKTGTSSGHRDSWTVGWDERFVVAVWVGNSDGSTIGEVAAVRGAAPLWSQLWDALEDRDGPRARPEPPAGLVREEICALSGLAATERCPHGGHDWRLAEGAPTPPCTWHGPRGGVSWPPRFSGWAQRRGRWAPTEAGAGQPRVAWPTATSVISVDLRDPLARQRVALQAEVPAGARRARWFVDDTLVAEVGPPFAAFWQPSAPGVHRLLLEVDGQRAEPVTFWVGMAGR